MTGYRTETGIGDQRGDATAKCVTGENAIGVRERHDVPVGDQKEMLARFRMASQDERAWIRTVMREHCAEHFPDVEAP